MSDTYIKEAKRTQDRADYWKSLGVEVPTRIYSLWDPLGDNVWYNQYHTLKAYVKWYDDYCTHLWYKEGQEIHKDGCYHHICALDDYIETLQTLKMQVDVASKMKQTLQSFINEDDEEE